MPREVEPTTVERKPVGKVKGDTFFWSTDGGETVGEFTIAGFNERTGQVQFVDGTGALQEVNRGVILPAEQEIYAIEWAQQQGQPEAARRVTVIEGVAPPEDPEATRRRLTRQANEEDARLLTDDQNEASTAPVAAEAPDQTGSELENEINEIAQQILDIKDQMVALTEGLSSDQKIRLHLFATALSYQFNAMLDKLTEATTAGGKHLKYRDLFAAVNKLQEKKADLEKQKAELDKK